MKRHRYANSFPVVGGGVEQLLGVADLLSRPATSSAAKGGGS